MSWQSSNEICSAQFNYNQTDNIIKTSITYKNKTVIIKEFEGNHKENYNHNQWMWHKKINKTKMSIRWC